MDLWVGWSNRAGSNITIHIFAFHKMKVDRIGWNHILWIHYLTKKKKANQICNMWNIICAMKHLEVCPSSLCMSDRFFLVKTVLVPGVPQVPTEQSFFSLHSICFCSQLRIDQRTGRWFWEQSAIVSLGELSSLTRYTVLLLWLVVQDCVHVNISLSIGFNIVCMEEQAAHLCQLSPLNCKENTIYSK